MESYGINVELTSTLRCGFHKYRYPKGAEKKLLADMSRTNNRVRGWDIQKVDDQTFSGFQDAEGKIYFYAVSNYPVEAIEPLKDDRREVSIISFGNKQSNKPLELKIGFSFVSVENAKMNLEEEMLHKSFQQVADEANNEWNRLLSHIEVKGVPTDKKGSSIPRSIARSCGRHCAAT